MHLWLVILLAVLLFLLRLFRPGLLIWQLVIFASCYITLKFGFVKPFPMSVVNMFAGIIAVCQVAYLSFNSEEFEKAGQHFKAFLTESKYGLALKGLLVLVPLVFGVQAYLEKSGKIKPPVFGRTIHPAPPTSISFRGKTIDMVAGTNPFRPLRASDPEKFKAHVDNGERIYCEQCSYCHGGNMESKGIYTHALDPLPIKFSDPTILPDLQESFLFWRIAKGAPDMPNEAAPWASSMPAFEPFLTEEEIWDVTLYLYEFNGMKPRAISEHAGGGGH